MKIEAKLGAAFEMDQLHSYVNDLEIRSGGGLLLMLVPHYRSDDAKVVASSAFSLLDMPGHGPWQPKGWPHSRVAVITWEEILEVLQSVRSQPFANDLDQFRAMYEALTFIVESPTTDEEVLRWHEREGTYINLIDRVSRRLTTQGNVMPIGKEVSPIPHGYRRRYVCLSAATVPPYLSVGVRDPFAGPYITPIWLRFRSGTPGLSVIRTHIAGSDLSQRKVESGGHIWIPLDVRLGLDGEGLIASLVAQARDIIEVAYAPSSDGSLVLYEAPPMAISAG